MTRDETIKLWQKCEAARAASLAKHGSETLAHEAAKAVWNTWAENILARRKVLEGIGGTSESETQAEAQALWREAEVNFSDEPYLKWTSADVEGGRDEDTLSRISSEVLPQTFERMKCDGFIFPGDTLFRNAHFIGTVSFIASIFYGNAEFDNTKFMKGALFSRTIFTLDAWFTNAEFSNAASFMNATFKGDARFNDTIFSDTARFQKAIFMADADFGLAKFTRLARFHGARFSVKKGRTFFSQAKFKQLAVFSNTVFYRTAHFDAVVVDGGFQMTHAQFGIADHQVPSFNQADFTKAPDLGEVSLPLPRWWLGHEINNVAKYRHLRRLSIQSNDFENEIKAFKGEMRSKRGVIHKPWHSAFWFGIFYDLFSDFGLSAIRPVMWWLASVLLAAAFYLSQNEDVARNRATAEAQGHSYLTAFVQTTYSAMRNDQPCLPATPPPNQGEAVRLSAPAEAILLAFRIGLVIVDMSSDATHQSYRCLYGMQKYDGSSLGAHVPIAVSIVSAIQKIFSAMFIFLFGLALRNMLKVK